MVVPDRAAWLDALMPPNADRTRELLVVAAEEAFDERRVFAELIGGDVAVGRSGHATGRDQDPVEGRCLPQCRRRDVATSAGFGRWVIARGQRVRAPRSSRTEVATSSEDAGF